VGLWNYIRLPASDRPILIFSAYSLPWITGTVHSITTSRHLRTRAVQSLVESPLEILLGSLIENQFESLALGRLAFSTGSFFQMANS